MDTSGGAIPGSMPGSGMCILGRGTLKGGTMTGGKAGMAVGIAAVGWATL